MQTKNDTSKPEDSPQQEAGEGCSEATCSPSSSTPITDALAAEIYYRGIRVSEIRMLEHARKMERERNSYRALSEMNVRDWRRQCLKSGDLEAKNRQLTEIIRDALMHLETNYDIDGASRKDSDAARKLRSAISFENDQGDSQSPAKKL